MRSILILLFMATNASAANITNKVSLLNISTETAVFSTLSKPQSIRCVNAAGTGYESCAGAGSTPHGDGTNATSGFLCLGVDEDGNCQTALIDATAVDSSTNPVQSNFLFDHDADVSAHHTQTTPNDDAADATFNTFIGTHSSDASAHHSKTVSSEIDHDSITGVSTADHHTQTTANDDVADAAFALFQGTHSADSSAHHVQTVDTNTNASTICSATEYLQGNGSCDVLATGSHTTANDDAADASFALFQGTHSADSSAHHTKTVSGDIDHDSITGVSTSDHHVQTIDTNTNATTICSATEYLEGDGTCDVLATGPHTTANDDAADSTFSTFLGTHSVDASAHHTATNDTNASTICTGTDFLNGSGSCVAGSGHGDGTNATSGNVCLGVDASGNCQEAVVDALAVDTSTNPVQSNALFDHSALFAVHHSRIYEFSWGQDTGKGFKIKTNTYSVGPYFTFDGASDTITSIDMMAGVKAGSGITFDIKFVDEETAEIFATITGISTDTYPPTNYNPVIISTRVPTVISRVSIQGKTSAMGGGKEAYIFSVLIQ